MNGCKFLIGKWREIIWPFLEGFSIGVYENQTQSVTLANHNRRKQRNEPIRTPSKYVQQVTVAKRENACKQVTIGVDFASHWLGKWRKIC